MAADPVSDLLPTLVDFLADADQLLCGEQGRWAAGEDLLPSPDSPLDLLLRIRTEAMHTFHALLRVTDDPMAAPAAPILVRQLLECWAHVQWIAEGQSSTLGPTATPEQRAICLELGMAHWLCKNLSASSNESQYEHSKADGEKWVKSVTAEHEQIGCACSGRDFKAVRNSFKELRDRFGMDWPLDTYIAASAASHALMPQRLAHQEGTGLSWGGPASLLDRQNWLARGFTCLINVYLYVIGTLHRPKVGEYDKLVAAAQTEVSRTNRVVVASMER